ncbi:hypothetical protein ACKZDW_02285 (plasmid) [Ralstonia syzygii subsp. celebesensis]
MNATYNCYAKAIVYAMLESAQRHDDERARSCLYALGGLAAAW